MFKTKLGLILLQMDFGVVLISVHFLMFGFLILLLAHVNSPLSTCHKINEADKRRNYDERVREVEHGSFTPLIVSTAGVMSPAASNLTGKTLICNVTSVIPWSMADQF